MLAIRSLSVVTVPDAVVLNVNAPGMLFTPGVPSTTPLIYASGEFISVPSSPENPIEPTISSS